MFYYFSAFYIAYHYFSSFYKQSKFFIFIFDNNHILLVFEYKYSKKLSNLITFQ